MTYTPKHLQKWTADDPSCGGSRNYAGAQWPEWYVVYIKSRDASILTQSNFAQIMLALEPLSTYLNEGGEDEQASVFVNHTGHWAVGWIDWIMVHESNEVALRKADELVGKMKDYPVLNEDDFSQREWDAVSESWEQSSIKERIDLCKNAGVSIFAARRKDMPSDDTGYIFDRLRPE